MRLGRDFWVVAWDDTTLESSKVGEFAFDDTSEPALFSVGVAGSGKGRGWCLVETIFDAYLPKLSPRVGFDR